MTNEPFAHVRTERLWLDVPTPDDVEQLHAILSDPRVWTHLPSGRFTDLSETERTVEA